MPETEHEGAQEVQRDPRVVRLHRHAQLRGQQAVQEVPVAGIGGAAGPQRGHRLGQSLIVANRFRARVRDVTYMGEDLHLRVLALEKQPLLVSIKNSKGTRAIVPGVAIELAIDPEDIHILRR